MMMMILRECVWLWFSDAFVVIVVIHKLRVLFIKVGRLDNRCKPVILPKEEREEATAASLDQTAWKEKVRMNFEASSRTHAPFVNVAATAAN